VTAKRDSKRKPKKDERPKIKKETLKDLEAPEDQAKQARGGARQNYETHEGCPSVGFCSL
jgi:hypothetical protein